MEQNGYNLWRPFVPYYPKPWVSNWRLMYLVIASCQFFCWCAIAGQKLDLWIQGTGMSEHCPLQPFTNPATLPWLPDSENCIHLFSKLSIFLWWAVASQHIMLMPGFAGHNDSWLSIACHKLIDPLEKLNGYNFFIRQPWRGRILHKISLFSWTRLITC